MVLHLWLLAGVIVAVGALLAGCGAAEGYRLISQKEAKELMKEDNDSVIVDVRTKEEYDEGHIPGAVLVPIEEIREKKVDAALPDKDALLLLYCRTGRRAEDAAALLAEMGYTDVRSFGGIVEWDGEVETE
ncbi:MAG: rhodanese-like domain-containing protein [Lachnospiraceae bacterium]|nr:rhodanese-like domain-containing protein [Lachnospiraceae bacterium]